MTCFLPDSVSGGLEKGHRLKEKDSILNEKNHFYGTLGINWREIQNIILHTADRYYFISRKSLFCEDKK